MRTTLLSVVVALFSAILVASDHTILFDEDVNFGAFKTFRMTPGRVTSARPELAGATFERVLAEEITRSLTARGLREEQAQGDLIVEHRVSSVDWAVGAFGRASVVDAGRGGRRGPIDQIDFTDATLVIDLLQATSGALVWRGVFNETEKDAVKLANLMTRDAASLLAEYPPKKK